METDQLGWNIIIVIVVIVALVVITIVIIVIITILTQLLTSALPVATIDSHHHCQHDSSSQVVDAERNRLQGIQGASDHLQAYIQVDLSWFHGLNQYDQCPGTTQARTTLTRLPSRGSHLTQTGQTWYLSSLLHRQVKLSQHFSTPWPQFWPTTNKHVALFRILFKHSSSSTVRPLHYDSVQGPSSWSWSSSSSSSSKCTFQDEQCRPAVFPQAGSFAARLWGQRDD